MRYKPEDRNNSSYYLRRISLVNRTIKMLINLIRNYRNIYGTEFIVKEIMYKPAGRTSYPVYIAEYTDRDNKSHTKEIHSSFSIKKWKKGDIIKIKVDSEDPENIIIPFSDFSMAVIMSVIGIALEIVLVSIYTHINI